MWLTSSSIGRKFIMALTGACLVLFVTFHVVMNAVCIVWPTAYNQVCMFLGANWYALIASAGLAALFIIHIIYAIWLTLQNRKARGNDRYAVTTLPPHVEWSSKNMLVLGIVILAFLVVHLIQFWAKMQLQELCGTMATVDGVPAAPEFGTLFIQAAFKNVATPIIYIIGFVALWFHMTHGFWSMFHTVGWDNNIWICRLKCIGYWWTSIVVALFIAEAVVFTVQANKDHYTKDLKLQEQYAEHLGEKAEKAFVDLQDAANQINSQLQTGQLTYDKAEEAFKPALDKAFQILAPIAKAAAVQCPDAKNEFVQRATQFYEQSKAQYETEAVVVEESLNQ